MPAQPSTQKIGYLLKIFPKVSETFILQEVLDLEALGVNLTIFALQRPTDRITHGLADHVLASIMYLPDSFLTVRHSPLWAHLRLFIESPRRYLSTLRFWLQTVDRPSWSKFVQAGSLATALQDHHIDHLHVHFANTPTSVAELTHRFTGIPYSMTGHAKDIFLATPATLGRKMHHAEFVVTCTEHNRRYLQNLCDNDTPLYCLYHGLNLDRFDQLRTNHRVRRSTTPTIVSVGRFRDKKGFPTLVRACHLLAIRGHRFCCRIVGCGPLQAELETLLHELNLEQVVTLVGQKTLEEVVAFYQEADIFALPCQVSQDGDRDGIPNVLMEAMACRLPVVTTEVSGIPELVRHDDNGFLVPQRDPEALALALAHLIESPALRERLGQAGRETIEQRFSSSQGSQRLKALLFREKQAANQAGLLDVLTPLNHPEHSNSPSHTASTRSADKIGYVLKGFPRRSEAFITNEILLLEQMGLQLHLFSAFEGEPVFTETQARLLQSSVTYLPEDRDRTNSGFLTWLLGNLPRYFPSHLRLIRTVPRRYLRTAWEAWTLSLRCRSTFFSWPKKVFYKDFLRAGSIACSVLDTGNICHLHAHFCHGATTMAMFAGLLSDLPFSFTAHAKDIYLPKLNPGDLLHIKLRRAKFVVTCTGANLHHLQEISSQGAPIHTIYHGVDTARFAPPIGRQASAVPTILSVGRFVEKKGFPFLIEACRIIRDHGVSFRCRIVGEPDEQTDLVRDLIRRHHLEQEVSIGPGVSQEELRTIYQDATVFVLPCHIVDNGDRDGIPNVLAEAMASGVPVISTSVSGIPELIDARCNGLLVAPRDPVALANAIEELLLDSAFRDSLAHAGRETICRIFDSRKTTKTLFELFQVEAAEATVHQQEAHAACR
ncbi:MAG: glycosyltransferase [Nitrospira sp.]|nr:glycosyltransferase [Nitrospira sp.]